MVAKVVGVSLSAVQRIWAAHRLQPHRIRTFKKSNDPAFAAKVEDCLRQWLARRGFVVLSANMYGAGTSEQPVINDSGQLPAKYTRDSALGYYDALQYARSLAYVDQTRLGMWGHSQGYLNESSAIYLDGGYYTMNDRMLNVLHDDFGLEISEKQLEQKADDIAAAVAYLASPAGRMINGHVLLLDGGWTAQ